MPKNSARLLFVRLILVLVPILKNYRNYRYYYFRAGPLLQRLPVAVMIRWVHTGWWSLKSNFYARLRYLYLLCLRIRLRSYMWITQGTGVFRWWNYDLYHLCHHRDNSSTHFRQCLIHSNSSYISVRCITFRVIAPRSTRRLLRTLLLPFILIASISPFLPHLR